MQKKKFSFKLVWQSFKDAFKGFSDDKVTKLSASLSYYTVFSLAPLLIVIIFLAGIILGNEAAHGTVFSQLNGLIGVEAAAQIQEVIKNASLSGKSGTALIIGIVTLLIGSTTVFGEIQDSMNGIWGLKPKPKLGIMKILQTRLLSFGMIGTLGFFLLVSLAATTVVEGIGGRLKDTLPNVTVIVFYIINLLLNLLVTTLLFGIIFKVLPDAKIKWKDIWPGAIATSLLFLVGKFAISFYVSKSDIGSTFGAAGSLVILLVWIYYSSIILYFGAEFTKAYALNKGAKIIPDKYAQWNNEPVVSGAKEQQDKNNKETHLPQTAQPISFASNPVSPQKMEKRASGIGTVLVGLVLYLFNTSPKQTKES
jgi:membrane protein